jgi:hypothetical protein
VAGLYHAHTYTHIHTHKHTHINTHTHTPSSSKLSKRLLLRVSITCTILLHSMSTPALAYVVSKCPYLSVSMCDVYVVKCLQACLYPTWRLCSPCILYLAGPEGEGIHEDIKDTAVVSVTQIQRCCCGVLGNLCVASVASSVWWVQPSYIISSFYGRACICLWHVQSLHRSYHATRQLLCPCCSATNARLWWHWSYKNVSSLWQVQIATMVASLWFKGSISFLMHLTSRNENVWYCSAVARLVSFFFLGLKLYWSLLHHP